MRSSMIALLTAGFLAAVAALIPALHAGEADGKQQHDRPTMGEGMMGGGMMGGKMMGSGKMSQAMMDHCVEMMQGAGSGTNKPNDQWRDSAPTAPDKKG
ncbi:hypothetical protein [Desertibaculum subflavum]|uniref:hypothetical protein n=1 Tax=Desertibaculum subflavum TaxID=2268458 RepID=UPI0013C3F372